MLSWPAGLKSHADSCLEESPDSGSAEVFGNDTVKAERDQEALYRVRAVFVDGETGEWSDEVFVVTPEDKRQNLKKWLFIGGAIVAIATVALVLLQLFGSKGPMM